LSRTFLSGRGKKEKYGANRNVYNKAIKLFRARKALLERDKGNTSVLIFPIYQVRVISFLEDNGGEIRYAGKIRWLAVQDRTPNPADSLSIQPCVLIILRPVNVK
jgi:hypothetical protein